MGLDTNLKNDVSQKELVRSIRNRLFFLLIRAFTTVVIITLIIVIGTIIFSLNFRSDDLYIRETPLIETLRTYYVEHGSWDNVESLQTDFNQFESFQWKFSTLIDSENKIIIENGDLSGSNMFYSPVENETSNPIIVNGESVGKLVTRSKILSSRWLITVFSLGPVFLISIFLALLTTLIGLFLTRRVVIPLAEVTAASQEVTLGKLDTRVNGKGTDDLRMLIDSFNQMTSSLERNDQERRDMLADVAHELRTPLSILKGRLEGVIDGIYPYNEENLSLILESTYMLEHLVEDLRLLSLVESKQVNFDKNEIDLIELSRNSIMMFNAEAQEKDISLSLESNASEAKVILDPQRMEQVIGNLVENALQYTPAGGRVWIDIQVQKSQVTISVNDDGKGILQEDLPYIFNRFWRKEKSRSRGYGGSGLGLAITKKLVEAQGGKIFAENNVTNGLSVIIVFSLK